MGGRACKVWGWRREQQSLASVAPPSGRKKGTGGEKTEGDLRVARRRQEEHRERERENIKGKGRKRRQEGKRRIGRRKGGEGSHVFAERKHQGKGGQKNGVRKGKEG